MIGIETAALIAIMYLLTLAVIIGFIIFWVNRVAAAVVDLRKRASALEQQVVTKKPSANPVDDFRCL